MPVAVEVTLPVNCHDNVSGQEDGRRDFLEADFSAIDLRRLASQVRFGREREEVPTQPDDSVSRRVHPNHTFKQNGEGFPGDDELGDDRSLPRDLTNATTSAVPPG